MPPVVRRFFAAGYASPAAQRTLCGSETAATSTRAPSTALELDDDQSIGTDGHSEHMLHADSLVTCPGSRRMAGEQLDHLASELREQLDEEHTSLLASIEEVQGLMEAEVAAPCTLPSLHDLSSFVEDVERNRGHVHAADAADAADAPNAADVPDAADAAAAADAPAMPFQHAEEPRPRWADLSDSDTEDVANPRASGTKAAGSSHCSTFVQSGDACLALESCDALRAPCQECGELLVRSAFSRRAWRRARSVIVMGDCADSNEAETGTCLACSKNL